MQKRILQILACLCVVVTSLEARETGDAANSCKDLLPKLTGARSRFSKMRMAQKSNETSSETPAPVENPELQKIHDRVFKLLLDLTGLHHDSVELTVQSENVEPNASIMTRTRQMLSVDGKEISDFKIKVSVHESLLELCESEDDLAFVLLHEFYHDITDEELHDYLEQRNRKKGGSAATLKRDFSLLNKAFHQANEHTEDIRAFMHMIRLGYSAEGAYSLIRKLGELQKNNPKGLIHRVLSSHPDAPQRLSALEKAQEYMITQGAVGPEDLSRKTRLGVIPLVHSVMKSAAYTSELLSRIKKDYEKLVLRSLPGDFTKPYVLNGHLTHIEDFRNIKPWEPFQEQARELIKTYAEKAEAEFQRQYQAQFIQSIVDYIEHLKIRNSKDTYHTELSNSFNLLWILERFHLERFKEKPVDQKEIEHFQLSIDALRTKVAEAILFRKQEIKEAFVNGDLFQLYAGYRPDRTDIFKLGNAPSDLVFQLSVITDGYHLVAEKFPESFDYLLNTWHEFGVMIYPERDEKKLDPRLPHLQNSFQILVQKNPSLLLENLPTIVGFVGMRRSHLPVLSDADWDSAEASLKAAAEQAMEAVIKAKGKFSVEEVEGVLRSSNWLRLNFSDQSAHLILEVLKTEKSSDQSYIDFLPHIRSPENIRLFLEILNSKDHLGLEVYLSSLQAFSQDREEILRMIDEHYFLPILRLLDDPHLPRPVRLDLTISKFRTLTRLYEELLQTRPAYKAISSHLDSLIEKEMLKHLENFKRLNNNEKRTLLLQALNQLQRRVTGGSTRADLQSLNLGIWREANLSALTRSTDADHIAYLLLNPKTRDEMVDRNIIDEALQVQIARALTGRSMNNPMVKKFARSLIPENLRLKAFLSSFQAEHEKDRHQRDFSYLVPSLEILGLKLTPKNIPQLDLSLEHKAELITLLRTQGYFIEYDNRSLYSPLVNEVVEDFASAKISAPQFYNFIESTSMAGLQKMFPVLGSGQSQLVNEHLKEVERVSDFLEQSSENEDRILSLYRRFNDSSDRIIQYLNPAAHRSFSNYFERRWTKLTLDTKVEVINAFKGRDPDFRVLPKIDSLLTEIEKSKTFSFDDLKSLSSLTNEMNADQMNRVWALFNQKILRPNQNLIPYDQGLIARAIKLSFGNYLDGKNRAMQEIFWDYELGETEMSSLKDILLNDNEKQILATGKLAEVSFHTLRSEAESHSTDEILDFIRWLNGELKEPPKMAFDVVRRGAKLSSAAEKFVSGRDRDKMEIGLSHLLDQYRNLSIEGRVIALSPLINHHLEGSLLTRKGGREKLVDYLLRNVDEHDREFFTVVMNSYLEALGPARASIFLEAVAGSADPRAGKNDQSSVEQVKLAARLKGTLWIKLVQQFASDPTKISDHEMRSSLLELNDRAQNPNREEVISMLKEALQGEYSKVLKVHQILGAGSVNVVVEVTLSDGNRYAARMVRKNPEQSTRVEVEVLQKMAEILDAEMKKNKLEDPRYRLLIDGIRDYLPTLSSKIAREVDFNLERAITAELEPSYTRDFDDLQVSVRLAKEAKDIVDLNAVDSKRIMFIPIYPNGLNDLTPSERLNAKIAVLRTEWQAIFQRGIFDPDGHGGNYLVHKDPTGRIVAMRIDYSQAELQFGEKRRLSTLHALQNIQRSSIDFDSLLKDYKNLLSEETSPTDLAALDHLPISDSLRAKIKSENSAINRLMAFHEAVREQIPDLKLHSSLLIVFKSLNSTLQWLDPSSFSENQALIEEFLKTILNESTFKARWFSRAIALKEKTISYWMSVKTSLLNNLQRIRGFWIDTSTLRETSRLIIDSAPNISLLPEQLDLLKLAYEKYRDLRIPILKRIAEELMVQDGREKPELLRFAFTLDQTKSFDQIVSFLLDSSEKEKPDAYERGYKFYYAVYYILGNQRELFYDRLLNPDNQIRLARQLNQDSLKKDFIQNSVFIGRMDRLIAKNPFALEIELFKLAQADLKNTPSVVKEVIDHPREAPTGYLSWVAETFPEKSFEIRKEISRRLQAVIPGVKMNERAKIAEINTLFRGLIPSIFEGPRNTGLLKEAIGLLPKDFKDHYGLDYQISRFLSRPGEKENILRFSDALVVQYKDRYYLLDKNYELEKEISRTEFEWLRTTLYFRWGYNNSSPSIAEVLSVVENILEKAGLYHRALDLINSSRVNYSNHHGLSMPNPENISDLEELLKIVRDESISLDHRMFLLDAYKLAEHWSKVLANKNLSPSEIEKLQKLHRGLIDRIRELTDHRGEHYRLTVYPSVVLPPNHRISELRYLADRHEWSQIQNELSAINLSSDDIDSLKKIVGEHFLARNIDLLHFEDTNAISTYEELLKTIPNNVSPLREEALEKLEKIKLKQKTKVVFERGTEWKFSNDLTLEEKNEYSPSEMDNVLKLFETDNSRRSFVLRFLEAHPTALRPGDLDLLLRVFTQSSENIFSQALLKTITERFKDVPEFKSKLFRASCDRYFEMPSYVTDWLKPWLENPTSEGDENYRKAKILDALEKKGDDNNIPLSLNYLKAHPSILQKFSGEFEPVLFNIFLKGRGFPSESIQEILNSGWTPPTLGAEFKEMNEIWTVLENRVDRDGYSIYELSSKHLWDFRDEGLSYYDKKHDEKIKPVFDAAEDFVRTHSLYRRRPSAAEFEELLKIMTAGDPKISVKLFNVFVTSGLLGPGTAAYDIQHPRN